MLQARNISVEYDGRRVLNGVSLELHAGEIVALIGPNSAGKSTLIKTLNGSAKPTEGEIILNGRPLATLSRRDIASEIAVVAQENETRFPMTTMDFVLAGRFASGGMFGWESEVDLGMAADALNECDLASYEKRQMNELSGGERQRVVLARALATNARILLLDEPTANLDLAHQAMMFRLVGERCRTRGHSAVVITHDLNLAAEFADKILLLKEGRIIAFGNPKDVLTAPNISEVFGVEVLLDQNPASRKVRVTAIYH